VIKKINQYLSLVKFSHTVFALPFAMIGLTLGILDKAQTDYNWQWKTAFPLLFFKVLLCMVFARSAAMAFNRFLDRKFDALNPRTAQREIPAGIISSRNALMFTIVNCLLFILTTWFINTLVFYLSFVALFVVLFYSYTKRITPLCHLVLGVGLSLSPIGAFLAVTAQFKLLPVLFSLIVFTWVAGFDIIYALQDEEFDKAQKLFSIPAVLGKRNALLVSNVLHLLSALVVLLAGYYGDFNWVFWIGAFVFIGLLLYQHLLVSPNDLSKVNMAFANTNGIASILFALFAISSFIIQHCL
jgi:4-hydroxybenzoate polyprenyltransferase